MPARRTVITLLQLSLLIALLLVLYRLSVHKTWIPTAITGDNDEDDMKYKPIVPVSIGPVVLTTLRAYLDAYGTVEPQPARPGIPGGGASINSPTSALVASVDVVEGQAVKAGQPLFHLDDRAVAAAIAKAQQDAESAERIAREFDNALKTQSVPQAQVLRAHAASDAAKATLAAAIALRDPLTLRTPIDGIVAQLRVHTGEPTPTLLPAVQLIDPSRLVVAVQIPAWQLPAIKVGQAAILGRQDAATSQPASTQPATTATVTYIDPEVDPHTGLGLVDVSVPDDSRYRVGQFVSLRIVTDQHDRCLAVPTSGVVQDPMGNSTISVVEHDYRWAFRRVVQLGIRDNGLVEVIGSDLKPGQSVVTTGSYALSDQCQIEVTP